MKTVSTKNLILVFICIIRVVFTLAAIFMFTFAPYVHTKNGCFQFAHYSQQTFKYDLVMFLNVNKIKQCSAVAFSDLKSIYANVYKIQSFFLLAVLYAEACDKCGPFLGGLALGLYNSEETSQRW